MKIKIHQIACGLSIAILIMFDIAHAASTIKSEKYPNYAFVVVTQEQEAKQNLDDYVGNYKYADGYVLTISRKGNTLMVSGEGIGKSSMKPAGRDKFAQKDASFKFIRDANGKVTQLETVYEGKTERARKVN